MTSKMLRDVTTAELNSGKVYITPWSGVYMVGSINSDCWVRCPKANGGFGQSFCCHAGTELLIAERGKARPDQDSGFYGEHPEDRIFSYNE